MTPRFRDAFANFAFPLILGAGLVSVLPLSFYWYTALAVLLSVVGVSAAVLRIRFRWFVGGTALLLALASASTAQLLWRIDHPERRDPDKRDLEITQDDLFETIWALEYLKKARGSYPMDITELPKLLGRTGLGWDRTIRDRGIVSYFFYTRLDDDHYHLRARGADGYEFTDDDVIPEISDADLSRIGFVPISRR